MEALYDYNPNFSLLGNFEHIFCKCCDECINIKNKYHKLDKKTKTQYLECKECSILEKQIYYVWENLKYEGILVNIHGNPAPPPSECTYYIKIWVIKNIKKKECKPEVLQNGELIEFSLGPAVNGCDLDHTKKNIVETFYKELQNIQPSTYSFKGKCDRKSYINEFVSRIDKLVNSKERIISEECAHVSKRKKGYYY